jgi:hypothetical protein
MSIYHSEGAGDVRFLDLSATNIEPQELLAFAIPADAYAWKVVSLSLSSCWLLQPLSLMCVVQKFHALRILDISDMPGASPDVAKIASAALVYCDVLEHLNISKNDVRYTDLVKFFNRIPEFGDSLTNLEMAGMYITDVPAQVDLSTTNSFDVLWELLFDTDLSHLNISHCRISTGAMLLLIKTNLCLSDLRVDDLFVRHGRPTVLDCERLRKTWAVRKNTGLEDGAWPAPYWINHRSFYWGEAIPRFREESKDLLSAHILASSGGWASCRG